MLVNGVYPRDNFLMEIHIDQGSFSTLHHFLIEGISKSSNEQLDVEELALLITTSLISYNWMCGSCLQ
jgi:hypothetical protein